MPTDLRLGTDYHEETCRYMEQGTIKIHAHFFFAYWMLFIFTPRVSIDGGEWEKPGWGHWTYQLDPGEHSLHIKIPYVFYSIGKVKRTLTVNAGETLNFKYRPKYLLFLGGKLSTVKG